MKFVFTKHAIEKFTLLKSLGWKLTRTQIKKTIKSPRWSGVSQKGQSTAMILVDRKHIVRVVFRKENDIIVVITFHIARRGKYESTL